MITINAIINQKEYDEANAILESVGISMEMAVGIFIKRVVKEKGLPIILKQSEIDIQPIKPVIDDNKATRKSPNTITILMVEEVWKAFRKSQKSYYSFIDLSDEIYIKTGMNRSSAFIYLNIISKMVKGEKNTRSMKPKDFEFFLERIHREIGISAFESALKSIRLSIPYWKGNLPTFADSMQDILDKNK